MKQLKVSWYDRPIIRLEWLPGIGLLIIAILMLPLIIIGACTRANISQVTSLGSPAAITCYSGGKVIYDGRSTGKISTEAQSDGWYFEDAETKRLVRVSGACVIRN